MSETAKESEESSDPENRLSPVRASLFLVAAIVVCLIQMVILWFVMERKGFPLAILSSVVMIGNILIWLAIGLAAHLVISLLRRRGRAYLRALRDRWWWITTALTVVLGGFTTYFYVALKTSVWVMGRAPVDQLLWNLDAALLFGMSPSVLSVALFEGTPVMAVVDATYGNLFLYSLTATYCLASAFADIDLRTKFFIGSMLLWSAGAWGYLAVPALGPAFGFSEVWETARPDLKRQTALQKRLVDHHQNVLEIARGRRDVRINMEEAIGAFPSLHVGFFAFIALFFGRYSRVLGRWLWVATAWTFFGSVVTGWHYLIDSIAGLLLAVAVWWLLQLVFRVGGSPEDLLEPAHEKEE